MATIDIEKIQLAVGGHNTPADGLCFNEAVAYFAGQPFSDAPKCVSPAIRRFTMRLNDRLDDERRQLLKPYIVRVVNTNTGREEDEQARRLMCSEWVLREAAAEAAAVAAAVPEAAVAGGSSGSPSGDEVRRLTDLLLAYYPEDTRVQVAAYVATKASQQTSDQHAEWLKGQIAKKDAEQAECDGGPYCRAPVHIHGCFAERASGVPLEDTHEPGATLSCGCYGIRHEGGWVIDAEPVGHVCSAQHEPGAPTIEPSAREGDQP